MQFPDFECKPNPDSDLSLSSYSQLNVSFFSMFDYNVGQNGHRFYKPNSLFQVSYNGDKEWRDYYPVNTTNPTEEDGYGSKIKYSCSHVEGGQEGRDSKDLRCIKETTTTFAMSREANCVASIACLLNDFNLNGLCTKYGFRITGPNGETYEVSQSTFLAFFHMLYHNRMGIFFFYKCH